MTPTNSPERYSISALVERLIELQELSHITGIKSKTQVYEKIKRGELAKPIKDGRRSLWPLSEAQRYVAQKIEAAGLASTR